MNVLEGDFRLEKASIGLVASRFNSFIVQSLVDGATDVLQRQLGDQAAIDLAWVPGALEAPLVARKMADSGRYDAIVVLGAVIRGSTPHFDIVANESAKGLAQVSMSAGIPVINAILTTNTIEQAIERAGTKAGNKGAEAAMGALEMISLLARL
ncbi:MAG TPA: 6,7-dimethyl-8-ribityllumazine synthase [Gammaproteobacteria bacterium]|nr:6,7-dimethyl-8-ribityllumazine synthase [Gammaproteobacteria bacterium]